MSLVKFLTYLINEYDPKHVKPVICFNADTYPILLSLLVRRYMQQKHGSIVQTCTLIDVPFSSLQAQLETRFLGMQLWYWLSHSTTEIEKTKQKIVYDYLKSYKGPHTIVVFSEEAMENNSSWMHVSIPPSINKEIFILLCQLMQIPYTVREEYFIQKIITHYDSLSLDVGCLLLHYVRLLSKQTYDEFFTWLPDIIAPSVSLFNLSQAFLAKQALPFFKEWQRINHLYATPFWVSFWSEQIWRSYNFVRLARIDNWIEAKKVGIKLPFSFIQRDWKKADVYELSNAHNALYQFDYATKHGLSPLGLELFYNKFFLNGFKESGMLNS